MTRSAARDSAMPGTGWTPAWWALLLGCAVALTAIDAVLLQFNHHYFSGGFNALTFLSSTGLVASFLGASIAVDAVIILGAWLISWPLLGRIPLTALQKWLLAGMLGVAGPGIYTFLRYQLQRYLGDLIDLDLILTLAGGFGVEMFAQASDQLLGVAVIFGAVLVAAIGLLWAIRRIWKGGPETERLLQMPRWSAITPVFGAAFGLSAVLLPGFCLSESAVCLGLGIKPSGSLIKIAVQQLTDADRDGAGLLSTPPDPDPFDSGIHGYALEIPGNAIDENGLAGDLPIDIRAPESALEIAPLWKKRPHVLLIFGESLRGDVLERSFLGREITPFISRLGREGASSRFGFTNVPYTSKSRAQLFGGRLDPYDGQTSLVDDFKRNGYTVAYFSGQDDSFGGRDQQLGQAKPDVFYDARQDPENRASRFTSPGSLSVSWKLLNRRIAVFLGERPENSPLFMYVNYHDTHFPYHHAELDRIFDIDPLARGRIGPETRDELWATYANASANVDRAVERLVEAFRASIHNEPHVILLTADHGESLFDFGHLGHGQALNIEQTRVPMVLWGIGGDIPEPIGVADLRGLIQRNLDLGREGDRIPQPHLISDSGRRIFQYMSKLARPRLVALRGVDGTIHYAFRRASLESESASGKLTPLDPDEYRAEFAELLRTWEVLNLREHAFGGDPAGPG